ncbi:MAG: 50S ribosomal protein L7/L12 [Planctomycetota bacterium]
MSDDAAVAEFSAEAKELGDKIAEMTLKQAKELSDYLKEAHGIEPAAGGGVVMAAGGGDGGGEAAAEEKTEFDVVLTGFGDKKLNVVKVVKNLTGASLMEAKKMVEGVPATLKEAAPKEEADKIKAEIEEAGGSVELK